MDPAALQPVPSSPVVAAPDIVPQPRSAPGRGGARARTAARGLLRESLAAGGLATASMLPFLLSPRPGPTDRYVTSITLWGPLHVNVNSDSGTFLMLAQNPGLVLTDLPVWQSRPLYPGLGWLLAKPFQLLGFDKLGMALLGDSRSSERGLLYGEFLPYFAGFILLNLLLLTTALMLFRRLVGATSYRDPRMWVPMAVLLVNEVTKQFFWTPHLQMFNVFIPVASLSLFVWMQPRLAQIDWRRGAGLGAALGVASLAYGAFAIPAGGAALLLLFAAAGVPVSRRAVRAGALLVAFFLPLVAWSMYVVARTGAFYSHEIVEYRQFVWMADKAAEGGGALLAALRHNLGEYVGVLTVVVAFPAVVIVGLTLARSLLRVRRPAATERERWALRAVLLYLVVCSSFFALMGYYRTRLAWALVPALLVVIAIEMGALRQVVGPPARRLVSAGAAVVALGYVAFWVTRVGPFRDATPAQEQMEHPGFPRHAVVPVVSGASPLA